jgi:hypothetical protein
VFLLLFNLVGLVEKETRSAEKEIAIGFIFKSKPGYWE